MTFLWALGFTVGCTDYGINPKGEDPTQASEDPLAPAAPIAITGPSHQTKRNVELELDGSASYDPDDDEAVLDFAWSVGSNPAQALVSLSNPSTPNPTFSADLIGNYVIDLMVVDEDGQPSLNPAATVVEILPWEDLELVLSWDKPEVDLDLHLLNQNGTYFGVGDCFFANPEPDWGTQGEIRDDPLLLRDDEGTGAGEVIVLEQPEEQVYTVMVAYHSRRDAENPFTMPTLSVRAEGQEIANVTGPRLTTEGTVWIAGTLDWPTLTFNMTSALTDHDTLGGPAYNE
ncbi:MAG: hypothetical protein VX519_06555 [Myxococcota bacterium]|nr:hypothetical protein [Myxococcota bacterium]